MIAPELAWQRLLPHLRPLAAHRMPLLAATGRVLAETVSATVDVPFADVSAVDGYALAGDLGEDVRLPVAGTIAAGEAPRRALPEGAAWRIMTGAIAPAGADRIVPVEHTDGGIEAVRVRVPAAAGANLRRQGEVHRRGERLLGPGDPVTPGAAALLASHGLLEVAVHRPPRVALLVTGDEVVSPEDNPAPGQLRDSHTAFVMAATNGSGATINPLGIAPDRPAELRERLARALDHDVLLVTGGVSRGEFDFVEGVVAELGFRQLFDAVAVQPGKPLMAAVPASGSGPLVFGLPGNPASVMVCYWLFVRPSLACLQGRHDGFWASALDGVLAAPLPAAKGRDRFLPARVEVIGGSPHLTPLAPRGSHDLGAYARGEALVRVRAGAAPTPAGGHCSWLPLPGFAGHGSRER
jgi:molybdopterin molybdotransferase